MLDYDAARGRVKKLIDKPSEDSTRLPKASEFYSNKHSDAQNFLSGATRE